MFDFGEKGGDAAQAFLKQFRGQHGYTGASHHGFKNILAGMDTTGEGQINLNAPI